MVGHSWTVNCLIDGKEKSPDYGAFLILATADGMASAGLNCCSTVCQHKCI